MRNSYKRRTALVIAVVILSIVLTMLLALLLWLEFGTKGNETNNKESTALQQTENATSVETTLTEDTTSSEETKLTEDTTPAESVLTEDTGIIDTPYLNLYYDKAFSDYLLVIHNEGPPYRLEFYVSLDGKPDLRLFDIAFGKETDGNLGAIKVDAETIPVNMVIYTFDPDDSWTQDEINTIFAMQEMTNDLIDQLMVYQTLDDYEGPVVSPVVPEQNDAKTTTITTPYCNLYYSSPWTDYLYIEKAEGDNYRVFFYGQLADKAPVLLFTIIFGGDSGEQVGAIIGKQSQIVPVNIMLEELDRLGWAEYDMNILYEMQEAINLMLERIPFEQVPLD